jgi:hypothetical protein
MPDAIAAFQQFTRDTGPALLTGPEGIVNDQQSNNFETTGYLARGQKMSDVVQGGSKVKDIIFLSNESRARYYQEFEPQTYQYVSTGTEWEVNWRKWMTDITIPKDLILLNAGAQFTAEHRAQQYKSIWFQKNQEAMSGAAQFQEDAAWAVPEVAEMETATGRKMFSIPAYINEFANGLPSAQHPGGIWSTVQGIAPATYANWVPQQFNYTDTLASNHASYSATSLIGVFDKAWNKLKFRPPPHNKEYFEKETAKPINVVLTSLQGKLNLLKTYRNSNDRWEDTKDPFMSPMYDGAPIVYVSKLDTAAIYPTGAGTTTADAALSTELDTANTISGGNAGPRYYLIQPDYLRMVWFRERMLQNIGEKQDVSYPDLLIYPILSMSNMICRSRRRHGIIYPSADIT